MRSGMMYVSDTNLTQAQHYYIFKIFYFPTNKFFFVFYKIYFTKKNKNFLHFCFLTYLFRVSKPRLIMQLVWQRNWALRVNR